MLERSFGLLFFLKSSKSNRGKERNVYARITVNGKSKEFSTKRSWCNDRWDQNIGRAIGNKEDARTLNHHLEVLSSKVYQAKSSLLESGEESTAEIIYNCILGKTEDRKMILDIFWDHNTKMEALVGADYASGTLQRYKTSLDHTRAFIKRKYGVEDMELRKLNYEFISEYAYWLKTERKCCHNTTVKYLSNFKKIVLHCVKLGWLAKDPFYGYKLTKKEVERVFLNKEELQRLHEKKLLIERLELVKDIFLFSCYTGLAYVDVQQLKVAQIVTGIDNEKWIFTKRQKTGSSTRLPLLDPALEILQKYEDHPRRVCQGFALPILSNQKMNAYLKEIADLCGITKELTFHIARHTFATTVTLTNGVPIESVSKMLGHKSLRQTQHYAKIIDLKISNDMKELKQKLTKSGL